MNSVQFFNQAFLIKEDARLAAGGNPGFDKHTDVHSHRRRTMKDQG